MKNGLYQQLLDHNFNNVHMILELEGRGKISQAYNFKFPTQFEPLIL